MAIDLSSMFGKTSEVRKSAGGKGGKKSDDGLTVREEVCLLIRALYSTKAKHPSGADCNLLDRTTEEEFTAWKRAKWGALSPKQPLKVYVGHYQRLEHGYGPDAAYITKNGKRVLRADSDKHANSLTVRSDAPFLGYVKSK